MRRIAGHWERNSVSDSLIPMTHFSDADKRRRTPSALAKRSACKRARRVPVSVLFILEPGVKRVRWPGPASARERVASAPLVAFPEQSLVKPVYKSIREWQTVVGITT